MPNTLTEVVPKLLAQGLLALRQNAIMPRIVNRRYEVLAGAKGSIIDVPIPSAVAANAVTAANTPPAATAIVPTAAHIALDQWFAAEFELSDRERMEVMEGTIPMQASEAIKSLANVLDAKILANYKGIYSASGAAGTTPFASNLTAYDTARKLMNITLAPLSDRRVVLDPSAEANAVAQNVFRAADASGSLRGIMENEIGHRLGADWYMDQNVPVHAAGPWTGSPVISGAHTVGATSLVIAGLTTSVANSVKQGDIFTIAGSTQQYANLSADQGSGAGTVTVSIAPSLKVALSGSETVAAVASHTVNLLLHRDCFAFASRPLLAQDDGLGGSMIQSAVDPVSGVALRLEVQRWYKKTVWSFDVLFGTQIIRPELGCRILG